MRENHSCRQSHPKPYQSHPEAKAEGRMKNAEGPGEAIQSHTQGKAEGRTQNAEKPG
jgi:hypothetical protein